MSFLQNLVFAGPFVYTLFYFVAILGLIRRTSDCLKALGIMVLVRISTRLRWSRGERAGLWYPSSRVQTRPKPSDFLGEKILSAPSFGGEVKPSVPCKFTACKRTQKWRGSRHFRQNSRLFLSHIFTFRYWGSLASSDAGDSLWREVERSNYWSSRLGVWRAAGNGRADRRRSENIYICERRRVLKNEDLFSSRRSECKYN